MYKQDYSFHTHAKRCGHAWGRDEDYIQAGIKMGFSYFGFSDHVMLPGLKQSGMRGDYDHDFPDYLSSLNQLREKYKDTFDLQIGFECEWYDRFASFYREILAKNQVDYLILGQHCYLEGDRFHYYSHVPYPEAREMYVNALLKAMESGLFLYVAHPDYIFRYCKEVGEEDLIAARKILEAAARLHIPLEINLGPSRWDRRKKDEDGNWILMYPQPWFWDIAKDYDIDVVIGPDVHDPAEFALSDYEWAYRFVSSRGMRLMSGEEIYRRIQRMKKSLTE